jgi:hypothetical protein
MSTFHPLLFRDLLLMIFLVHLSGCGTQLEVMILNEGEWSLQTPVEVSEPIVKFEPRDAIDRVLRLKSGSYHTLLREASRLVPPALLGMTWVEVQRVMQEQSLMIVKEWQGNNGPLAYYILKRGAFVFSNGFSLDLYVLLGAVNEGRHQYGPCLGKLYQADVALVGDINAPYAQVVAEERFPKGSVLEVALSCEEVRKTSEVWPILGKVCVYYGYLADRWLEFNPSGFRVDIEFTASAQGEIGGREMIFTVVSGLDPLRSSDGTWEILNGFKSEDTLHQMRVFDGLEWGHPERISANNRKYLRSE